MKARDLQELAASMSAELGPVAPVIHCRRQRWSEVEDAWETLRRDELQHQLDEELLCDREKSYRRSQEEATQSRLSAQIAASKLRQADQRLMQQKVEHPRIIWALQEEQMELEAALEYTHLVLARSYADEVNEAAVIDRQRQQDSASVAAAEQHSVRLAIELATVAEECVSGEACIATTEKELAEMARETATVENALSARQLHCITLETEHVNMISAEHQQVQKNEDAVVEARQLCASMSAARALAFTSQLQLEEDVAKARHQDDASEKTFEEHLRDIRLEEAILDNDIGAEECELIKLYHAQDNIASDERRLEEHISEAEAVTVSREEEADALEAEAERLEQFKDDQHMELSTLEHLVEQEELFAERSRAEQSARLSALRDEYQHAEERAEIQQRHGPQPQQR